MTAPPTTAPPDDTFPVCTEEEADLDATRSYAPEGALPTPGDMPAGSTMAEIQDRGRLIVGVSADTLQFGALDEDGTPEGFDVDILKEVAKAIFGDGGEERIEYRVMNYAGRLPSLEDDDVDLVAHTMTINCDRWKRIAFSSTYYDAGQKVLVPTSSTYESVDDLVVDGATVCVPGGSTNYDEISKPEYTAPEDGGSGIDGARAARHHRLPRRRAAGPGRRDHGRRHGAGRAGRPGPQPASRRRALHRRSRTASGCAPTRSTSCGSSTASSRTCAPVADGPRSTRNGSARRWSTRRRLCTAGEMRRRLTVVTGLLVAAAGCGAPQLAAPDEVTAPPPTAVPTTAPAQCTADEAAADATRSYAPDGPRPAPGAMPAGSTMAEIAERGRLIVGVSADTLQFGAVDPISGAVEGFDVDLLKEIAKAIFGVGGENRIEYRVMTFAERLPGLEDDEVDLVAHTMTINCERWKRIAFSSTYYDAGKKVLVDDESDATSVDDLVAAGARVCAPDGSTSLALIEDPAYTTPGGDAPGIEVVIRPDVTACLVAVQQGDADAVVGDDTVLVGLAAQDPNLVIVGAPLTDEPYGIGVNADEVDLAQFVNGVLEDVRSNGRWGEIYTEWVGGPDVSPPAPPEPVYGR